MRCGDPRPHTPLMDAYRCPDCNAITGPAVTDGGPAACPLCRLPLDGPEVAELRALDAELLVVETRRAVLHRRRAALVGALRARRRPVATAVAATAGHVPPADGPARSAQTVLLTLGGMLIVVAGLVFTLVSWGRLGIGGRAAVLTALTALVLAAPLALRRRGLDATAETASAVGLALVLLDAYAARAADLGGLLAANGAGYWAAVTGLGAVGAGAYGRLTRSVLAPYAALLLLQCAAPLTAAALHAHATGLAYALLAGAVLDLAVAVRMPVALGAAAGWTVAAGVVAAGAAYGSGGYGPALRACGPLLLAAALALAAARSRRLPGGGGAAAAFCGLALVAAAAVTPWLALPQRWAPLAAVAPAALLAAAALLRLRQVPAVGPLGRPQPPLWAGLFYAAALVLGLSALDVLPLFLRALRHLTSAGVVPVVAAVLALVLAGAAVRFGRAGSVPRCAAVLAAVAAVVTAPLAAGLPYAAALAAAGVPALGAGVHLLRRPTADPAPQLCALLASSAVALVWSLPHDTAALTVWDAAAVLAGCLAAGGRIPCRQRRSRSARWPTRPPVRAPRPDCPCTRPRSRCWASRWRPCRSPRGCPGVSRPPSSAPATRWARWRCWPPRGTRTRSASRWPSPAPPAPGSRCGRTAVPRAPSARPRCWPGRPGCGWSSRAWGRPSRTRSASRWSCSPWACCGAAATPPWAPGPRTAPGWPSRCCPAWSPRGPARAGSARCCWAWPRWRSPCWAPTTGCALRWR